jgi:hypothetical protein
MWWRLLPVFAVAVVVIAAICAAERAEFASKSPLGDQHEQQQRDRTDNKKNATSQVTAVITTIDRFIAEHHDTVIALGTLAIAAFTGTLWWATRGLRRLATIQKRDMQRLARATRRSARIAERALTLAQRPLIKVRDIEPEFTVNREWYFHEGEPVTGHFWIGNSGGSEATVKIWSCHVLWSQRGLPPAWPVLPTFNYDGSDFMPVLPAGVHSQLRFQSREPVGKEGHDISTGRGEWQLYVFGRITYADQLGIMRTTAFCRRFNKPEGGTGRFVRVEDPDLEYED